jgi:hypothetical protein
VYPDACIIQTHRDPARVLFSYASLIAGFRSLHEDGVDAGAETRRQMELWARGLEKGIAAREGRAPRQFYDLHFRDFTSDPLAAVKRIYAHFDQALSPAGEEALRRWQASNPAQTGARLQRQIESPGAIWGASPPHGAFRDGARVATWQAGSSASRAARRAELIANGPYLPAGVRNPSSSPASR